MKKVFRRAIILMIVIAFVFGGAQSALAADDSDDVSKPVQISVNKVYTKAFEKASDVDCFRFKSGGGSYKLIVWFIPGEGVGEGYYHYDDRITLDHGLYGTIMGEYCIGVEGLYTLSISTPGELDQYTVEGEYVKMTFDLDKIASGKQYGLRFNAGYKGGYKFQVVGKEYVVRKSIKGADVTVASPTYTGKALKPKVTVKLGSKTLEKDTDYTVTYAKNINAGSKASVTITGIGKYKDSLSKKFTIKPRSIKDSVQITLSQKTYTYNGKAKKPSFSIYMPAATGSGLLSMQEGVDYTYKYQDNVEPGTAKLVVTGKGNYTGTATRKFTIEKKKQPITTSISSISKAYKNIGSSVTFTVDGVKESAEVTAASSNTKVATVKKEAGKYKVTIKGVGSAKITVSTKATKHYRATSKTITVTVADRKDPQLTVANTVYDLELEAAGFNLGAQTAGNGKITYAISAEDKEKNIAAVDGKGNVTLKGNEGTITITVTSAATDTYKKGTVKVSVTVTDKNKLYWPVRDASLNPITQISSHPGQIVAGNPHRGIDIANADGAGWYAAYGGTVVYVFRGCITNGSGDHADCAPSHPEMTLSTNEHGVVCNNGFGNGCIIKSVIDGKTYYFQYAHMDSVSDALIEGMEIAKKTYLGQVGDRGFSFGTHAHFEIDEETSAGSYWGRPTDNDPESEGCEFQYRY